MTKISKLPTISKSLMSLLVAIYLECPVHAGAGNVLGVLTKPHTGGHGSVVVHYLEEEEKNEIKNYLSGNVSNLQLVPLLAEINSDIRPSYSKVGTTGVKAEVSHFISIL
jgi:hypothetical protein